MTEVEWLACTDRQLMLAFLENKVSERKLRLLAPRSSTRPHSSHVRRQ
jgi:hypothetical protein